MDYETEIIDGHKAVVRHIFKAHEIQVGSRWARADGSKGYVTVEGLNSYGDIVSKKSQTDTQPDTTHNTKDMDCSGIIYL